MSGSYMGKHWDSIDTVFNIYEIEDRKTIFFLMKHIEAINIEKLNKEAEDKRKRQQKSSSNGGINYTHNKK